VILSRSAHVKFTSYDSLMIIDSRGSSPPHRYGTHTGTYRYTGDHLCIMMHHEPPAPGQLRPAPGLKTLPGSYKIDMSGTAFIFNWLYQIFLGELQPTCNSVTL